MWPVFVFLKEIIPVMSALYQEKLNVYSWMIFCPDGIIPDSGLTGPINIHIYLYIRQKLLNEYVGQNTTTLSRRLNCRLFNQKAIRNSWNQDLLEWSV